MFLFLLTTGPIKEAPNSSLNWPSIKETVFTQDHFLNGLCRHWLDLIRRKFWAWLCGMNFCCAGVENIQILVCIELTNNGESYKGKSLYIIPRCLMEVIIWCQIEVGRNINSLSVFDYFPLLILLICKLSFMSFLPVLE